MSGTTAAASGSDAPPAAAAAAGSVGTPVSASGRTKVLVLTGPTAVGKTKASLALAAALGGEIISADSVQVGARGASTGDGRRLAAHVHMPACHSLSAACAQAPSQARVGARHRHAAVPARLPSPPDCCAVLRVLCPCLQVYKGLDIGSDKVGGRGGGGGGRGSAWAETRER